MELRCLQEEVRGGTEEASIGAWWPGARQVHRRLRLFIDGENRRGIYTIRAVHPTASSKGTTKYQELKANTECLHIEIGSPTPTDEQLMFEAASGSNKGHVYDFGSQSAAITAERWGGSSSSSSVPSASSAAAHESCIEKEKRLWDTCSRHRCEILSFLHLETYCP
ncbi:hypothetical protein M9H77_18890 [Catharanthus roseus]|uniref:Uncharacterized protein n=1 Tax=Catharanthus roseus TaxID=4058 RepID=A0ACC0B8V5_CATRO|nr:hypothetical protein M9H77_18890 [Catharanthus roseus]